MAPCQDIHYITVLNIFNNSLFLFQNTKLLKCVFLFSLSYFCIDEMSTYSQEHQEKK